MESTMTMTIDLETLKTLQEELEGLRKEHRDLDDEINYLSAYVTSGDLRLHRLKKRKLLLKDQITKLQSLVLPDIIA